MEDQGSWVPISKAVSVSRDEYLLQLLWMYNLQASTNHRNQHLVFPPPFPTQSIMPVYLISRYKIVHNILGAVSNKRDPIILTHMNRIADPLFAMTMGVSAALTRIRRDQREQHPERASEITYGSIVQTSGRRLQRWWNGDFQDV